MARKSFLVLLTCAVWLAPTTARANGRYPHSQKVYEAPGQASRIYVRTTFGLLESADAGASWYHVCERVVFGARVNYDLDPLLEIAGDGTLLSGSWHGMRVSRDGACSWQTETALPVDPVFFEGALRNDRGAVVDLTRSRRGNVYALVTWNQSGGDPDHHAILTSTDNARSWAPLGNPISISSVDKMLTVEIDPEDENRIYTTGRRAAGNAVLGVSTDGGDTWQFHELDAVFAPEVYLLPSSPALAGTFFARGRLRTAAGGTRDELYYSPDRGASWHALLSKQAALLGFAIALDGSKVLAAYGDTGYAQDQVNPSEMGIYRSGSTAIGFEKIFDGNITCLDWYPRGLYACSATIGGEFQLGLAVDASFALGDDPFRSLLKLPDISGPLPWSVPAPAGLDCADDWRLVDPDSHQVVGGLCQKLGACRDGSANGVGPPTCGGGGGATERDASGGGDGAADSAGDAVIPDGGGGSAQGHVDEAAVGCGCSLRAATRSPRVDCLATLLLGYVGHRRRRRHLGR